MHASVIGVIGVLLFFPRIFTMAESLFNLTHPYPH